MTKQIAVTTEMQDRFASWFRQNYPGPDTVIHDPDWHAPKIFRAALLSVQRSAEAPDETQKPVDRMKVQQAFIFLRDARPANYEAAILRAEAILEEALGGGSDG